MSPNALLDSRHLLRYKLVADPRLLRWETSTLEDFLESWCARYQPSIQKHTKKSLQERWSISLFVRSLQNFPRYSGQAEHPTCASRFLGYFKPPTPSGSSVGVVGPPEIDCAPRSGRLHDAELVANGRALDLEPRSKTPTSGFETGIAAPNIGQKPVFIALLLKVQQKYLWSL
jgi:hypothetical protein